MTERVSLESCIPFADRLLAGEVRGRIIVPISDS
jgi:acrylyl-CoA reductase (NADPH)